MPRGDKVFTPIGMGYNPFIEGNTSAIGVNDVILHALLMRLALSDNETVEFRTIYDKGTDTVEIDIPDHALQYFDQLLGMQRGPRLKTFIDWLIGSETLTAGSVIDEADPAYVSAGSIVAWSGAAAGNLEDKRLVLYLPAECLSVVGYNFKAGPDFDGGKLRIYLYWVYDSGNESEFEIQASVEVADLGTDTKNSYTSDTTISTFNLVHGDIRETLIMDTGDVIAADNLINIILRRNFEGSTDPKTDLVGIVGLKVELIENE